MFTESSEPTHVTIDVNSGKWEQLVFDRPPGVDVPDGAPVLVFDYDHQPEDEAAIEGPDDTITT